MIWTDWGHKRIEKSLLDGSNRSVLVKDRVGYPNGVTIDMDTGRVYWCDAHFDKIESINMDGTNRLQLPISTSNIIHPFGITTLDGYLFWTDWGKRAIMRSSINGSEVTTLRGNALSLMGLQIFDERRQQGIFPSAEHYFVCFFCNILI